ncbi:uncharacterized protein LACBIDRAFT_312362 [Laccaria bicolor S238N-H82]|uniref:Predicted protein n=1 Tax=Laccaria bicolor (strain S238N-H82 / ATCC MYA-4686) TaxID=486041 RepID=B0DW12_LACBS|nr:uncharacterized protein LACBIDRAFT_312362 [Laccaria bicolor S238N-H82]EDR01263.1 predicted protein [Laccaria bicolor S238N-H82]|eukprot:XP_001888139.1 predicted protein [Laccaria bicolor S238N-H82]
MTRYKKKHVLPGVVIPGPNKPKNSDSFMFRSFHHISACQHENNNAGIPVWDGARDAIILSRIIHLLTMADAVGLVEMDGRVGHHGAQGCRIGCPMKGRHKPSSASVELQALSLSLLASFTFTSAFTFTFGLFYFHKHFHSHFETSL